MSIELIKEKILANAKEDARRIFDKGKMESRALVYEAERKAEGKIKDAKRRGAEEAARIKSRRESIANLETRKLQLAAKQQVIADCFDEAKRRIVHLPREDYMDFLVSRVESLGAKEGEISLNRRDLDALGQELLERVNRQGGAFTLAHEPIDAAGGFTIAMGRVEVDSTVEMLLASIREEVMPQVVAALFG